VKQIEVHNYIINYKEEGKGSSLFFVHGSASDARTWDQQFDYFKSKYHTVVYNRRYHYPNIGMGRYSEYLMSRHLDDLEALIESLGKIPVNIVGHSYGAMLALLFAIKYPTRIKKLVLAEPSFISFYLHTNPGPAKMLKLLVIRPGLGCPILKFGHKGMVLAILDLRSRNLRKALTVYARATLGHKTYKNLTSKRLEQILDNFIPMELLGLGFTPVYKVELQKIKIPVLLLSGEKSNMLFGRFLDALDESLFNSTRCTIGNGSHLMHEDNASEFNSKVLQFLQDVAQ